jgi:hypothetical protein
MQTTSRDVEDPPAVIAVEVVMVGVCAFAGLVAIRFAWQ